MLTQDHLHPLLASLSHTLTRDDAPEDTQTAAALLDAFHPQTPIQAMLAAQAIALHHAAMDCFAGAMQTPEEDRPTIVRLHRNAASLTRAFTATLRALQRDQAQAAKQPQAAWQNPLQREPAPELRPGGETPAWPLQPQPSQLPPDQPAAWQNAQQDPLQREPAPGFRPGGAPAPGLRPGDEPAFEPAPQPHRNRTKHPMQREDGAGASPVVPAQAGTQGATTHSATKREAPDPRFHQDNRKDLVSAQHPLQREAAAPHPQAEAPAQSPPVQRPWELLTEAEQFAILYPERVAAGATSHEDADLWLPRFTNPNSLSAPMGRRGPG